MRIVAPIPQQGGPRRPQNPIFFEKRNKSLKRQKLKIVQKYAKISNMPFHQRSLIHWEGWFPPCFFLTKNTPKLNFFKQKKSYKTQKLKNIYKYSKISNTPFDQRSLTNRKAWFPPCVVRQYQPKKTSFFILQGLYFFIV